MSALCKMFRRRSNTAEKKVEHLYNVSACTRGIYNHTMVVMISPFIPRGETSVSFIPHSLRKAI